MKINHIAGCLLSVALLITTMIISLIADADDPTKWAFGALWILSIIGIGYFGLKLVPKDTPPFTGRSLDDTLRDNNRRDSVSMSRTGVSLDSPTFRTGIRPTPTSPTGQRNTSSNGLDRHGNPKSSSTSTYDSTTDSNNLLTGMILYDTLVNTVEDSKPDVTTRDDSYSAPAPSAPEPRAPEAPSAPEPERYSAPDPTPSYDPPSDNSGGSDYSSPASND